MTVAFIATVNLDDLYNLPDVAAEISERLTQSGFEVLSVAPWAHPITAPTTTVPTQTTTQTNETNI